MIPKFEINDSVEVKINKKFVRTKIVDFEIFDNLILYYTENGKAYPENVLEHSGTNGIRYFLNASTEQKDRDFLRILKELKISF